MRVAAFSELTGPDGVSVIDQATPEPERGEAVVSVEACAINRHDPVSYTHPEPTRPY